MASICSNQENADTELMKMKKKGLHTEAIPEKSGTYENLQIRPEEQQNETTGEPLPQVESTPFIVEEEFHTTTQNAPPPLPDRKSPSIYHLRMDDIVSLAEVLTRIAHKWEEIAIALKLPKVARVECGNGSSLDIKLYNVLEVWIGRQYPQTRYPTLQNMVKVLSSPIVRESILANQIEHEFMNKVRPQILLQESPPKFSYNTIDREILTNRYLKNQEIPPGSWPPVGTRSFTNLALVKSTDVIDKSHYSVHGNTDDVLATKEAIEYKDVFGKYESGLTVLVLGRPGCGKTTLVHKVCKDWANSEALREAELVYLISLRVLNTFSDHSLAKLLQSYYFRHNSNIAQTIEDEYGRRVCFILDGFDEYLCSNEVNSVVYALLNKSYLPRAMVIITSRPAAASAKLSKMPSVKRIEVFGFAQEQIYEYIDSFPFSTSSDSDLETHSSNLKAYLNINPQVLHMCYLPINTAIICFLYDSEPNNMPQTQTKMYKLFTRLIILRHLIHTESSMQLGTLQELTGDNAHYFHRINKLAYDMTINSQQVICIGRFELKDTSLGLATIDITASVTGYQNMYTFLHLTLQEFLAAYHISRLPLSEQMEIIIEHSESTKMLTVWKFYFGLVKFETGLMRAECIFAQHNRGTSPLFNYHCAYESAQISICRLASKEVLKFPHDFLTIYDIATIAYVMSTTASDHIQNFFSSCVRPPLSFDLQLPTQQLELTGQMDDRTLTTLLSRLNHDSKCYLEKLRLNGSKITSNGVNVLVNWLQHTKVKSLILSGLKFDLDIIQALFFEPKLPNCLTHLHIPSSSIDYECAELLGGKLLHTNIHHLGISTLDDRGLISLLFPKLNVNKPNGNHIDFEDTEALANWPENNSRLVKHDVASNYVGRNYEIPHNIKLETLNLSHNSISDNGIQALVHFLHFNTTLLELTLRHNQITDTSGGALGTKLVTAQLQRLDLSLNNIGDEWAKGIASGLSNTKLLELNLSYSAITEVGVIALLDGLNHNTTLAKLNLSCNHAKNKILTTDKNKPNDHSNQCIKKLALSNFWIHEAICSYFLNYNQLQHLCLSYKPDVDISSEMAIHACLQLLHHPTLQTLQLYVDFGGTYTTYPIEENKPPALSISTKWTTTNNGLTLVNGWITNDDALTLANGIQKVHHLKPPLLYRRPDLCLQSSQYSHIRLGDNNINNSAIIALLESLKPCDKILSVEFGSYKGTTDDDTIDRMKRAFQHPTLSRRVSLSSYSIQVPPEIGEIVTLQGDVKPNK